MRTITLFSFIFFYYCSNAQVDIQPTSLGINVCNSISELGINSVGLDQTALYVEADYTSSGSNAIVGKAYDITTFGGWTSGVVGNAGGLTNNGTFAVGVQGVSFRTSPSNNGRNYGVYGAAGDATPGFNYGVFGRINGTNAGTAIYGLDFIQYPSHVQNLHPTLTYAGYFQGKGYFSDELGIGENEAKSKLHVKDGDIYVDGVTNGIILTDSAGDCHKITIDVSTGDLVSTPINCP